MAVLFIPDCGCCVCPPATWNNIAGCPPKFNQCFFQYRTTPWPPSVPHWPLRIRVTPMTFGGTFDNGPCCRLTSTTGYVDIALLEGAAGLGGPGVGQTWSALGGSGPVEVGATLFLDPCNNAATFTLSTAVNNNLNVQIVYSGPCPADPNVPFSLPLTSITGATPPCTNVPQSMTFTPLDHSCSLACPNNALPLALSAKVVTTVLLPVPNSATCTSFLTLNWNCGLWYGRYPAIGGGIDDCLYLLWANHTQALPFKYFEVFVNRSLDIFIQSWFKYDPTPPNFPFDFISNCGQLGGDCGAPNLTATLFTGPTSQSFNVEQDVTIT